MKPIHVRSHVRFVKPTPGIDFQTGKIRFLSRDPVPAHAPNPEVREAAEAYMRSVGRELPPPPPRSRVDPERARRIAQAYRELEHDNSDDPAVRAAYERFATEVFDQWEFMKGRVRVEFTTGDPYPNSAEMLRDIRENRRLRVYTGGPPHPIISRIIHPETGETANSVFRAVHDYFGHAMNGNQFGVNGEESAWMDHSLMFSPLAQRAMTTETRGQNSFYNWVPENEGKPHSERTFAPQKADLLPAEFWS